VAAFSVLGFGIENQVGNSGMECHLPIGSGCEEVWLVPPACWRVEWGRAC